MKMTIEEAIFALQQHAKICGAKSESSSILIEPYSDDGIEIYDFGQKGVGSFSSTYKRREK